MSCYTDDMADGTVMCHNLGHVWDVTHAVLPCFDDGDGSVPQVQMYKGLLHHKK